MKKYHLTNNIAGFVIFAFATFIYWRCMEPTLSFWDCGEFIAAAFKMEVGHQPGAPLFLMIGKLFSLLAGNQLGKVAYWVNFVSVVSSAATIMFLFWSINAIALKLIKKPIEQISTLNMLTVIASGTVGALAYTFSDTFWFSAVEAEVYAISTLCTAIVFWAILKWENQLNDRWLLFISFIIGLSIGMHLLSLLVIPTISLVYYFRKSSKTTLWGTIKAFLIGCTLLGLVQFGVIQYVVLSAAKTDLLFVNTLGMGFGTGALFFLIVLIGALVYGIYYSIQKKRYHLNLGLLCLSLVLFGFSSYFMIIIRANSKTNINLSNPDTPLSLYDYLGRTQYEDKPLLYGQFYNSNPVSLKETGTNYRKENDRYEVSGKSFKYVYDKNTLFPRMFSSKPAHIKFYQNWMGLGADETPSFGQNLSFFNTYQLGFMYWRYFLWNFVGRQNDEQGQGAIHQGNWLTGIKSIDALRLGNQDQLPLSITTNKGHNIFYGLPLVLGILGLIYLYRKDKKLISVLGTLFFCTGIAIILYINQDPLQVRERDYAYVGSFYAFAIFIGLGVMALKSYLNKITNEKTSIYVAATICLLGVPTLMAIQGWDDHDRTAKTTALDMAKNYLNSCEPNAILFTNADNDTYPLWYAQEVEGIRTDVRVVNLQFLSTAAYIDQMKKQQYQSAPLPITLAKEKYKEGVRDYLSYIDYGLTDSVELGDLLAVLTSDNKEDKIQMNDGSFENFLPTKNLKLSINPAEVISTQTLPASQKNNIAEKIEWKYNKNHVFKGDLAMFDIIVNNHWKRPIYFATSVSEDTYLGLDKYLYQEGFAYRLLPLQPNTDSHFDKNNQTSNELAYKHYQNFELDGFKNAKYLDPESRRVLQGTWALANILSTNLIQADQFQMAKKVLDKSLKKLPLKNSSISDTLNKVSLVQNLYAIGYRSTANEVAHATQQYISQEFEYILSLNPSQQQTFMDDIRRGIYVLQAIGAISNNYKDKKTENTIQQKLKEFEAKFALSLGS
ncbi:DUF2723 domain-containing protein [Pedobacter sp. ASV28]|uniref:glycosyltransferase family 117 protein n=1 Tax=Pedobacter sp. ASV28 TaxID=2795123 RepID=UPI0018EC11AD|nr:DUF2723 domain-containing protein [Pedobacter sp. ASV28]